MSIENRSVSQYKQVSLWSGLHEVYNAGYWDGSSKPVSGELAGNDLLQLFGLYAQLMVVLLNPSFDGIRLPTRKFLHAGSEALYNELKRFSNQWDRIDKIWGLKRAVSGMPNGFEVGS